MNFYVIGNREEDNLKSRCAPYFLLKIDLWNDYNYRTQFYINYVDNQYEKHDFGLIKIAFDDKWKGELNPNETFDYVSFIPKKFEQLEDGFYSIGDLYFYKRLKEFFDKNEMIAVLKNFNDVAYDLGKLNDALSKNLGVIKISLLRDYKVDEIRNKIHRMAVGGVELTNYNFSFDYNLNNNEVKKLCFTVRPGSLPPTNIHVIIGGNGVGKTTLLNKILKEYFDQTISYKMYHDADLNTLSNLVVVSYSPFDRLFKDIDVETISQKKYSYIGLREDPTIYKTENYKNISATNRDFVVALFKCKYSDVLKEKWLNLI